MSTPQGTLFELSLMCPQAQVDLVSDALMELDALSVAVEDADADSPDEQALFGEPGMPAPRAGWQRSILKALYPSPEAVQEATIVLLAQDFAADVHVQGVLPVNDQDWVRITQSQFAPVSITDSFWIVPSWHEAPPQARTVMRLDPGLAFGTGTHPTTRMCLRWLASRGHTPNNDFGSVLDYGCGSGVLAIAAGLLGASDIVAVDIDPAAVTATAHNALTNNVALRTGLPEAAQGQHQLVIANILATPLKLLAPLLCNHLAPGGQLLLSGLLERQADEIAAVYAPWLALRVADQEDGWVLMGGRKA
jgi:ribosomal protein L11 methyltransferase